MPPTWETLLGEEAGGLRSQRDLSLPVHAAARARLFEGLSPEARVRLAACHGHGAAAWLSALPTPGVTGTAISGVAMHAAVRLWLGAPPRSTPPGARCRCGAAVGVDGRHFLGTCAVQRGRHMRLHNHLVQLVAAALRRSGVWGSVVVEVGLDGARATLRPDLRATRTSTGGVAWGDVSVTSPFPTALVSRVAVAPLRAVAAETREAYKVSKYAPALPASNPPHSFTPLVWEVYGRVGPQTADWLRTALGVPGQSKARQSLLTAASVALWRSNARGVVDGYGACFGSSDPPGLGAEGPIGSGVNSVRVGE